MSPDYDVKLRSIGRSRPSGYSGTTPGHPQQLNNNLKVHFLGDSVWASVYTFVDLTGLAAGRDGCILPRIGWRLVVHPVRISQVL